MKRKNKNCFPITMIIPSTLRNYVKYWSNVANGLYSEYDALEVFDRYFEGITPPITFKWLSSRSDFEWGNS